MTAEQHTLVCWHAERAGTKVLETALERLRNRRVTIEQVLYLVQQDVDNEQHGLVERKGSEVEIERIQLALNDPTDHQAILSLLKSKVIPRLHTLNGPIHINISPGTPAMHAVWLVLHAGGAFPPDTKLWSSQFSRATKRYRIDEVEAPISTWLAEVRQQRAARPRQACYEPEAESEARRAALERLALFARVQGAPILILGERGVGKTRLVETLVAALKQRSKVVCVACGGLESELAESLMFGHRKGAFTGAQVDRKGLLAEADGGILFLDEIQDLPKSLQRKLVRTLQDRHRRFRRLGDDKESESDFELVCASNLPLAKLRERLDADLFDRVSHLLIEIPPLRRCRNDIRTDWQQVWNEMRQDASLPQEAPWSKELSKALEVSPLRANMRDLQRLALLIFAFSNSKSPTPAAISSAIGLWQQSMDCSTGTDAKFGEGTRQQRLQWFRAGLARWSMQHFGSLKEAATQLSCDPKTLREDAKFVSRVSPPGDR